MAHDELFKELLREFFPQFMQLFCPDAAARLDFDRATPLDRELFTDLPGGSVREPDFAAQIYTRSGEPGIVLLHVEVQAERRGEFRFRMFEYYMLLRLRFRVPIFPVVLYLAPGAGGLTEEEYAEGVFGRHTLTFRYAAVGLPDLRADDYLDSENPLGPALAALMRASRKGRPAQKQESLERTAASGLNEAQKLLLANVIETYLKLSAEEEEAFAWCMAQTGTPEVKEMVSVYEERGIVKGLVQGKRESLGKLLGLKFGPLPDAAQDRLNALSAEELDALLERVLSAQTLQDMGLDAPGRN